MYNEFMETNTCLDEQGNYPRKPNEVVSQIQSDECANLQNNSGLDGKQTNNYADLQSMICDIRQGVEILASQKIMTIAANEVSKCQESDDPTLASEWSRILRYAQAVTCILCKYDPKLATILLNGRFPQILMGNSDGTGYPRWVSPDAKPESGSNRPVTSGGVYQAIQDALMSVWHLWAEHPEFNYFAQTLDDSSDNHNLESQMTSAPASEGDTALVGSGSEGTSLLYTYTEGAWVFTRVLDNETDNLTNFATTHIVSGFYATKGVYYFDGTWQIMDADISDIQDQIDNLDNLFNNAVLSSSEPGYILTTASDVTSAQAVPCDANKQTIVLITG